jgi:bifunctional DNA-binding transcriptional regulator/antitoxin component of YhaV-PrlF toxin-antitoxin module
MTLNYQKIWDSMNSLEAASSKICSAREILDSAIISLESGNREKTETLMYAVDEFLQYYLEDFDRKFKDAWDETVVKLKQEERDDYMRPWGHSDMEALSQYTDEEMNAMCDNAELDEKHSNHYYDYSRNDYTRPNPFDKVVKWRLPVEEDTVNGEYFITFPDDLLEAANLSPNDEVEWVEQEVGTFLLRKIEKTLNHDEAIAAGWTMTDDGFWVKE